MRDPAGHVGAMVHGRTGTRTLDDPEYDDLFGTAGPVASANLHSSADLVEPAARAANRGADPLLDLSPATFARGIPPCILPWM